MNIKKHLRHTDDINLILKKLHEHCGIGGWSVQSFTAFLIGGQKAYGQLLKNKLFYEAVLKYRAKTGPKCLYTKKEVQDVAMAEKSF